MEKQQKNKMGYAPITPLLASMALPAMISMLIQALYKDVYKRQHNYLRLISCLFNILSVQHYN